ncbi:MAG: hypothetical protein WCY21_07250 [Candidatus Cloacimonadaceae bacterium]|jgi:hypothetical protein|nr:hypothetical protein [Candidatus Cloacimonadota bacterium]MDX9949689.1 hypothetical protein [Candidatus Syntrophosphaera sp.]NLN85968.1 hypothetical protein [Candidatus Cloacimonadota bacterium]
MAIFNLKKLVPTFIPVAFELMRQFKRDVNHNSNIRKINEAEEKLATIEHLIVKIEKRAIVNRDEIRAIKTRFTIFATINSALLIAILIKLFFLA